MRCFRALVVAALAGLPAGQVCAQHFVANWVNPINGSWNQASRWSTGQVPNNQPPITFDVFIAATGSPYTVTLNARPTLNNMTLDSLDATMFLNNRSITLTQNYTNRRGLLLGIGGNDTVTVAGESRLEGGTIRGVRNFRSNGNLRIDLADITICDTSITHGGINFIWDGAANIRLDRGARLVNGTPSTWSILNDQMITWNNNGDRPTVENLGTMVKSVGIGVTEFFDVRFVNTGTLRVESGTFRTNGVTIVANELVGGRWVVGGDATLELDGPAILTNAADVELAGVGATFAAFDGLETNAVGGRFTVTGGRDFTTAGDFTNDGVLTIGNATEFRVAAGFGLTNFSAGTLTGGQFDVGGTLRFDDADIQTLAGRLTLDGAGSAVLDQSSQSGLRNFDLIDTAGDFGILNGRDFVTGSDFLNDGILRVGANTEFEVAIGSSLLNISGDTITGGSFLVAGKVIVDAAPIEVIASRISLDGPDANFESRLDAPLLDEVRRVASGGTLEVLNGRDFLTSEFDDFTVDQGGAMSVGENTTFTVAPNRELTNIVGGELVNGDFRIAGTLEASNAEIQTLSTRLVLDSPTGRIQNLSGVHALAGLSTITPGGSLVVRHGADLVTNPGTTLISFGELIVGPSALMDPTMVQIGGTLIQEAGLVSVTRASLDIAGQYLQNGGVLSLDDGTLRADGGVILRGTGGGSGIIDANVQNFGTLAPGLADVGVLQITGTLGQRLDGIVVVDIGGLAPGIEHDVLMVGSLIFEGGLAGELRIENPTGFRPRVGDVFDVIFFSDIDGDFTLYSGLNIAPGRILIPSVELGFIRLTTHVPAPGAAIVLGAAGLLAMRRRR